ncbi:MAG: glucosidase, partial [Methylomicrobium sp.]|nr:glucosidase [Methylomicrobium sp.]
MNTKQPTAEQLRIDEQSADPHSWRAWGPYLSERQWGTVREDYSADGEAWDYFPFEQAKSRAYRWGEDGIAGFSDIQQKLCLSVALWNEKDPILKERLFGLSNGQGNHGEDVKELYYYLDATPSHAYLKMLYKYPQTPFPYHQLLEESRVRDRNEPEYELLDTGVFDNDRYFDVFVEYAKAAPDDILMRITAHNRGSEDAPLHILPQLWFRNTWSWGYDETRPSMSETETGCIAIEHETLGSYHCYLDGTPELLFCDNDTNSRLLFGEATQGYCKDGFNNAVVNGERQAVNPAEQGT